MSTMPATIPSYITRQRVNESILPVEYTSACRAIAACRAIDETKYWSDKADALAAWAKIYKHNQAAVEAKRLKLHAYRRMSEIADQLRPADVKQGPNGGSLPGPRSLLLEHGLSKETVKNIRRIGAIPKKKFEKLVAAPKPPGITAAAAQGIGHAGPAHRQTSSEAWRTLSVGSFLGGVNPSRFLTLFCRRQSAKDLARGLNPGEAAGARKMITEIQEWCDEFEQYLPKSR